MSVCFVSTRHPVENKSNLRCLCVCSGYSILSQELLATVKAELNKQEAKQLDEKDYELSISQLQLQM